MITPLVSFDHCVVCPSSIYRLWLPLWYLLIIVVSVLRLTDYDYPFGIFKLFLIKKNIRENWRDNHEWTIKRQYQLKWWTTWTHHKTGGKIKCSWSHCYTHSTVFRGSLSSYSDGLLFSRGTRVSCTNKSRYNWLVHFSCSTDYIYVQ